MRTLLLLVLPVVGFVACYIAGYLNGATAANRKQAQAEPEAVEPQPVPVCGCGHNLALHDLKEGRCYAAMKYGGYQMGAVRIECSEPAQGQCGCRQYVGPEHPAMFLSLQDFTKSWDRSVGGM